MLQRRNASIVVEAEIGLNETHYYRIWKLFLLTGLVEFFKTPTLFDGMNNSSIINEQLDLSLDETVNTNEYSNTKSAVICAIIVMNVIMNSLVIAVIARYPQLREDRTSLFMFSLSVSDLAAGCTFMPISAALCSRATPGVADMVGLLPKIHAFTMWWFGFNSMYSLCWLTISKAIVIIKPFRVELLLTRKCCYVIIGVNWIIGCLLAVVNFKVNITWNTAVCAYRMPKDNSVEALYMAYFLIGAVLPVSVIIYGTVRIFVVVVRTHRQITALEQSVTVDNSSIGNTGFVTVQAIRSSKNIIIICVISLLLNIPLLTFTVLRNVTDRPIPDAFAFTSIWVFESNTFVNSLLYLLLFKSVRQKVAYMLYAILVFIRERWASTPVYFKTTTLSV